MTLAHGTGLRRALLLVNATVVVSEVLMVAFLLFGPGLLFGSGTILHPSWRSRASAGL